jgi:SAM-dependent methyltransferase
MGFSLLRRVIEPEWLDGTRPDDARNSLADLTRLNRYWGGYSSLARLLADAGLLRDQSFSVLDVGAASGDMARELRRLCPRSHVVSLDYTAHHLHPAPAPKLVADAFRLPFSAESFDVVFSSLFLHHFTDEQVVSLLRGSRRVARLAVLAIDLERSWIPYHFLPVTRLFLGWDRITVHDGPISVAAGFRSSELKQLAEQAGLREVQVRTNGIAFRLTLSGRAR